MNVSSLFLQKTPRQHLDRSARKGEDGVCRMLATSGGTAMDEDGTLRLFFDQLDLDTLKRFVTERRQEDHTLDFKLIGEDGDCKKIVKNDRKNLAKGISGFANAEGGVLIWGVDARKDDEEEDSGLKVDCAQKLCPIQSVPAALSALMSDTHGAVSPSVVGVFHEIIFNNSNDSGFIKTYVPKSDGGPHMAKMGLDHYFRRSGDSFRKMEDYEVKDMVHRESQPDLSVRAGRVFCLGTQGDKHNMHLPLYLYNSGRGAARWPVVTVYFQRKFEAVDPRPSTKPSNGLLSFIGEPELEGESRRAYQFYGDTVVIPPGASVEIWPFRFWALPHKEADLEMECSLYAESALPKNHPLRIPWEKIKLAIDQFVPSK